MHPREWYNESKITMVDPWKLRFTHNHISHKFRVGVHLDETIDRIRLQKICFDDLPPMEVFRLKKAALDDDDVIDLILTKFDIDKGSSEAGKLISKLRASAGELFSLNNRRLFVARVLRSLGTLDKVRVQEYEFTSERVQRVQRKEEEDEAEAKWLSAFSTDNIGKTVDTHSQYRGFEEPGKAVHTFELPEETTEEGATSVRKTLRNRITHQLGGERVPSRLFGTADSGFFVDVCVPPAALEGVKSINVPTAGHHHHGSLRHANVKNPRQQIIAILASQSGYGPKGKGKGKSTGKSSKGHKVDLKRG